MNMKKYFIVILILFCGTAIRAQVHLQKGSAEVSIPIYNFKDNQSFLSLDLSLDYSSDNGLIVDKLSGPIGNNWILNGVPSIIRIQKGLPDDQFQYGVGMCYNGEPITSGCANILNYYPIFENENVEYTEPSIALSDRQLDNFQLRLGGRIINFFLRARFATTQDAIVVNDNRVKIKALFLGVNTDCRTNISGFEVTDENGIVYDFSEKEYERVYKYSPITTNGFINYLDLPWDIGTEIPINERPYIISGWSISKIKDTKCNREIKFNYNIQDLYFEYVDGLHVKYPNNHPFPSVGSGNGTYTLTPCFDCSNNSLWELRGTIRRNSIIKKEIESILFPSNEKMEFTYGFPRKDLQGGFALTSIILNKDDQSRKFNFKLDQKYFIKNEIKIPQNVAEEKWSRLCLTSVQKFGQSDTDIEPPYEFSYYLGDDNNENFVPPAFFHARDPWGYFNGNKCGVAVNSFLPAPATTTNQLSDWFRLCLYNQVHNYPSGFQEIVPTCKINYAQNGLLKNYKNPYGGLIEYEYQQNKEKFSVNYINPEGNSPEGEIVGGVHVSKVTVSTVENTVKQIFEYSYSMQDGTSSLWGIEMPKFETYQRIVYEAEGQYSSFPTCDYTYKFPGRTKIGRESKMDKILNNVATFILNEYIIPKNDAISENSMLITILVYMYFASFDCPNTTTKVVNKNVYSFYPINFHNLLPAQFRRVIIKKKSSSGLTEGQTEYEFTSDLDFPPLIPIDVYNKHFFTEKQRCYYWMYGLPKKISVINNAGNPVSTIVNNYSKIISRNGTDPYTLSCNCIPSFKRSISSPGYYSISAYSDVDIPDQLKVDFVKTETGRAELSNTIETYYNDNGEIISKLTEFEYNPRSLLASSIKSFDSKGVKVEKKIYYPEDFDIFNPVNDIYLQLKLMNKVSIPIANEVWQTRPGGQPELLSANVTEVGIISNGDIKPIREYSLQYEKPVPENIIGVFDPAQLIRNPNIIVPNTEIIYDAAGLPVKIKRLQEDQVSSIIYDYGKKYPIASISNASCDVVAYTSFEADGINGWSFQPGQVVNAISPTGNKCFQLSWDWDKRISTNIAPNKLYTLSFWATSNSFTINGSFPIPVSTEVTINGWTYYQFDIYQNTVSPIIQGDCKIDELRFYPKNASMTTSTYDPGIGKTSECDINNRINYYEYDGFGRIFKEKDEKRNIIKTYEYHFKN